MIDYKMLQILKFNATRNKIEWKAQDCLNN